MLGSVGWRTKVGEGRSGENTKPSRREKAKPANMGYGGGEKVQAAWYDSRTYARNRPLSGLMRSNPFDFRQPTQRNPPQDRIMQRHLKEGIDVFGTHSGSSKGQFHLLQ